MNTFVSLRPSCLTESDLWSSPKGMTPEGPHSDIASAIVALGQDLDIPVDMQHFEDFPQSDPVIRSNVVGIAFQQYLELNGVTLSPTEGFNINIAPDLRYFLQFYPFPDPVPYFAGQLAPGCNDEVFLSGLVYNNQGYHKIIPCHLGDNLWEKFTNLKLNFRRTVRKYIYSGHPNVRDNFVHAPRSKEEQEEQMAFYTSLTHRLYK